jgi:hypothetical protein
MADKIEERRLKNWLDTFMDWTLPRSEAPESYIFWSGVFTIASVLRRKVKVPKKFLGSWECPPHMYIMYIGPAGGPKKTTSMSYAIDLLGEIPDITKGPTLVTQAALLAKLVEADDNSAYLTVEEFSDLVMKGGNEMYEFLTSMFDGKKSIESSTIGRGVEFVNNPCLNMIAATTPIWVAENMSEAIIGGGFSSRIIAIYEEESRRRRMYYRPGDVDHSKLDEFRADLIHDLLHIDKVCEGEFDIEEEALDFMENWYQEHEKIKKLRGAKMLGYLNRKPAHAHKLAMVIHISYSDDLVLTKADFQKALAELDKIEKNMPKVYEGMGKNPYTFDMKDIAEYIKENEKVEKQELLNHFASSAPPSMLNELIAALTTMGQIQAEVNAGEQGKVYYVPGKRMKQKPK